MSASHFTTPPLSPRVIEGLHQLGIHNQEQLRSFGVVKAFLSLKLLGLTITESVLWQLDLCSEYDDYNQKNMHLSQTRKNELRQQIKSHPPIAIFPPLTMMERWMQEALLEAEKAKEQNEVPVGAIIVHQNRIIARGHNQCIQHHDITAHAEINAIRQASIYLENYRLEECDLYVTLEPCIMCSAAIIQARIKRLIFAAREPKMGASGSLTNLYALHSYNQHTAVLDGVLATQSEQLLQQFFQEKRRITSK